MSHFSVIVVMDKYSERALTATLQPYHEYECTGVDDGYVIDVDVTDEVTEKWEKDTEKVVTLKDGTVVSRWDSRFYTGPEERGRATFVLPDGATESEMLTKDANQAMGISQQEWADDYGGWKQKDDGKFYKHTNPNKKWDWWQIGGRYSGRLYVKPGGKAFVGERSWTNKDDKSIDGLDVALKGDIDWAKMKAAQVKQRDDWIKEIEQKSGLDRAEIKRGIVANAAAHKVWLEIPSNQRPRGREYDEWMKTAVEDGDLASRAREDQWGLPEVAADQTVDEWVQAAPALTSFAVLKDKQWHERGNMGWWGIVIGEEGEQSWEAKTQEMVDSIRDDQWIAIVDCHI